MTKANDTGLYLERQIRCDMETNLKKKYRDVHVCSYRDYQKLCKMSSKYIEPCSEAYIVKNWPYDAIYSTSKQQRSSRTEYVLIRGKDEPIRIECKWQQSDGSVYEKYVYTIMSLYRAPEQRIIIVYAGPKILEAAIIWLKEEAQKQLHNIDEYGKRRPNKDIRIMSRDEFTAWTNNGLRW